MNSVRLVGDGGAEKVEGKGREMSQRARARSGRSAAVRTVECRMIVEYTDLGLAYGFHSDKHLKKTIQKNITQVVEKSVLLEYLVSGCIDVLQLFLCRNWKQYSEP